MPLHSEFLFKNGRFWTGNRLNPYAGQLVVSNGRISALGPYRHPEIHAPVSVDLKDHFVLPGFIDAHVHLRAGASSLSGLDLRGARNAAALADAVRSRASMQREGEWLIGRNWDNESWPGRKFPTRDLVDSFTPTFPVFLDRVDAHLALVNSRALHAAGITKGTPDPPGGVIDRDEHGEPTGILKDAAREMVLRLIPEPQPDELMHNAQNALKLASSLGVTSVTDIGSERDLAAYAELEREGALNTRINMILPISQYRALVDRQIRADRNQAGSERLRLGAVKAFADGSLGSGTAWFFDPYDDEPGNSGIPTKIFSSGELEKLALDADKNHIQLAIHAIGDRAVSSVLDIYERIATSNPLWDRRFRIEHAQHVRDEDIGRFKRLRVTASAQPYHCIDDGRWAARRIGLRREANAFPFRRLLDSGVNLAFGTDWPVAPLNPLKGIHAAVTRATLDGRHPGGWVPEEKIEIEEALKAYTFGSAYAFHCDKERGTLDTGKYADFAVLSRNPFETPFDELEDIRIVMTVVGGKIVFSDRTIIESVAGGDASV